MSQEKLDTPHTVVYKRIPKHLVAIEKAKRVERMGKVDTYECVEEPTLRVNRLTGEAVGYGMVL